MRTVYAVFDSNGDVVETLYSDEQDARSFVEDTAKREFASMKSSPRYGLEGQMVSRWQELEQDRLYSVTDEGHVTILGKWTRTLLEWLVKPVKLQERTDD